MTQRGAGEDGARPLDSRPDDAGIQQQAREILLRIADRSSVDALGVAAVALGDHRLGEGLDRRVGGLCRRGKVVRGHRLEALQGFPPPVGHP